jgi:DNA-binding NarL/FixJ family response regulator
MPPCRILVVDDFEPLRRRLCSSLEQRAEFQVIGQAADGLEAVQQTQELQPDLILLDIGLPKLNGIEAGRRIRKFCPRSKILFFSQETSAEVVHEAFRLGAQGYLLKSDVGELLLAVDAVLQGKQFISSHLRPYAITNTREEKVADHLRPEGPPATSPTRHGVASYPDGDRAVYRGGDLTQTTAWGVSGTYFEACNCEAICPCRKQGGMRMNTGSTYGVCDFALSWRIVKGAFAEVDLSDRFVVMAGSYRDDELNRPSRVILYVDERSDDEQFAALTDIFLGRAGGTTFQNFGARIGATYAVRRAAIELDHRPRRWFMRASTWVEVRAARTVPSELAVSCGIPGHDRPGNELIADAFRVHDGPLDFDLHGRCGFETHFEYSSQPGV